MILVWNSPYSLEEEEGEEEEEEERGGGGRAKRRNIFTSLGLLKFEDRQLR